MAIQYDTYDAPEAADTAVQRAQAQGLTAYKLNLGGGYWEVRTVVHGHDEMALEPLTDEPFMDPNGRVTFDAVRRYGF